ncbi:Herc4, partial [Symbiodinium sp. KB8]
ATRVFLKQSSDGIRMLNLSLSLLYDAPGGGGAGAAAGAKAAIRSLDVVCKSGAEFRLWSVGLAYLVQGPPPPAALAAHRAAVHAREERRTLWAALRRQVDAATGGFPGTLPWEVLAGPACRAEAAAAARAAGPFEDEAVAALRLPMATVPASLATASLTPSLAGAMLPTGFAEVVGGGAGGSRGRGNEIRLALRKARRGSNDVFAWGEGAWGQLGLGDDRDRESAQLLPLLLGRAVRQVAAGAEHTVAITGEPSAGRLSPRRSARRQPAARPSCGAAQLCAGRCLTRCSPVFAVPTLAADALEAFAWGSGSCGRLGTGSSDAAFAPQLLRHPTGEPFRFTKVACGARHSLAVAADGSLWAWGDNSGGQLLLGDRRCRLEPTRVDALSEAGVRAVDIAGGSARLAGAPAEAAEDPAARPSGCPWQVLTRGPRVSDGEVVPWPRRVLGIAEIGAASTECVPGALALPRAAAVVSVACGEAHTAAVTADGRCLAWGWNELGQCGQPSLRNAQSPRPVQSLGSGCVQVACGAAHTVVVARPDGGTEREFCAFAFGAAGHGQLGHVVAPPAPQAASAERRSARAAPERASGSGAVSSRSAGGDHSPAAWSLGGTATPSPRSKQAESECVPFVVKPVAITVPAGQPPPTAMDAGAGSAAAGGSGAGSSGSGLVPGRPLNDVRMVACGEALTAVVEWSGRVALCGSVRPGAAPLAASTLSRRGSAEDRSDEMDTHGAGTEHSAPSSPESSPLHGSASRGHLTRSPSVRGISVQLRQARAASFAGDAFAAGRPALGSASPSNPSPGREWAGLAAAAGEPASRSPLPHLRGASELLPSDAGTGSPLPAGRVSAALEGVTPLSVSRHRLSVAGPLAHEMAGMTLAALDDEDEDDEDEDDADRYDDGRFETGTGQTADSDSMLGGHAAGRSASGASHGSLSSSAAGTAHRGDDGSRSPSRQNPRGAAGWQSMPGSPSHVPSGETSKTSSRRSSVGTRIAAAASKSLRKLSRLAGHSGDPEGVMAALDRLDIGQGSGARARWRPSASGRAEMRAHGHESLDSPAMHRSRSSPSPSQPASASPPALAALQLPPPAASPPAPAAISLDSHELAELRLAVQQATAAAQLRAGWRRQGVPGDLRPRTVSHFDQFSSTDMDDDVAAAADQQGSGSPSPEAKPLRRTDSSPLHQPKQASSPDLRGRSPDALPPSLMRALSESPLPAAAVSSHWEVAESDRLRPQRAGAPASAEGTSPCTLGIGPVWCYGLSGREARAVACGAAHVVAAVAAEWVPDASTHECMRCHAPFRTLTLRRHHCRGCGGVFCESCTASRMPLLRLGYIEAVRVCDGCFVRLRQEDGDDESRWAPCASPDPVGRAGADHSLGDPLALSISSELAALL